MIMFSIIGAGAFFDFSASGSEKIKDNDLTNLFKCLFEE